jgi:hypothetical protein
MEPIAAARLAVHADECDASLEARLETRLQVLALTVAHRPATARAIALQVAQALHDLTGLAPKPEADAVMQAMAAAVGGEHGWDVVDDLRRRHDVFFFNATMFAYRGFARAMISHLLQHLSAPDPDFRYVADHFCRLLERRIPLHREDIAVAYTHGAAIQAFLSCTTEPT